MPSAPAPRKQVPRGFCSEIVQKGSCSKGSYKNKHEMPEKSRGRTAKAKDEADRPPEGGALHQVV